MSDKEKILTVVNKETGEIEARVKLTEKTFGKKRWLAMFQESLTWISRQHMTGEQVNVLCNLLGRAEFDNRILFDRKCIAEDVGIHPNQVTRAIRVLKEKNIIYEDPENKNVYKLNPYIGHKGTKHYGNNVVEFEKMRERKAKREEE